MERNAVTVAIIFFLLMLSFLIELIIRDTSITPPVIIGYCTEAGSFFSAIKTNRFPIPQNAAKPNEYATELFVTIFFYGAEMLYTKRYTHQG